MRTSRTARTGTAGLSFVRGAIELLGWGPVENPNHDLGTDLFVQVRDERGFDLGIWIGVQVKAGPSWFDQPTHGADGEVDGWWFYEDSPRHFEYWTEHNVPHILALYEETTRTTYWAHVEPPAIVSTGAGAKIRVPRDQVVAVDQLPALLAVATSARGADYQGSVWSGGARTHGLEQRLRYALLVPRLIAPHENMGHSLDLEPEEALALICLGRRRDYHAIAQERDSVPGPEEALTHKAWRWRLVGAMWALAVGNKDAISIIQKLLDEAKPGGTNYAAAVAMLISHQVDLEDWTTALGLAQVAVSNDDLEPADHAWITAHLVSLELEVGDPDRAIEHATKMLQGISINHADVTTRAMQAVAAWAVFYMAPFGARPTELGTLQSSSDNYVSWWRQSVASRGLAEAQVQSFRATMEDETTRIIFEDVASSRLWSAATIAQFAGNYASSRAHLRQFAMYNLTRAILEDDSEVIYDAADVLRQSTDHESLKLTIRFLETNGPLEALSRLISGTVPPRLAHSTCRTTIELWKRAGDFLEEGQADQAVDFLLSILDDPQPFISTYRPTFTVREYAVEALSGLIRSSSPSARSRVVSLMISLGDVGDNLLSQNLARLISRLHPYRELEGDEWGADLFACAKMQTDRGYAAQLFELAGPKKSLDVLSERAKTGDDDALAAFEDWRRLPEEAVVALMKKHVDRLALIQEQAKGGMWTRWSHDSALIVALLSFHWPDHQHWSKVLALLVHPLVSADAKSSAADFMAGKFDDLPADIRAEVKSRAGDLINQKGIDAGLFSRPASSKVLHLAVASDGLDASTVAAIISQALDDDVERREVSKLIKYAHFSGQELSWLTLLSDSNHRVRRSAATCIVEGLARDPQNAVLRAGVSRAMKDSGIGPPLTVAGRLHALAQEGHEWPSEYLRVLLEHRSAAVRLAARVGRTV